MNLAIDIGNTSAKWATFEGATLVATGRGLPADDTVASASAVMVCASGDATDTIEHLKTLHSPLSVLHSTTPLPIAIDYSTPTTLGPDRIAAACGAWALRHGQPSLVVDAGTCITADLVDATGTYRGGAIMPGLKMILQSLHTFTAKLPLLDIADLRQAALPGHSTTESIAAGALSATLLAIEGMANHYATQDARLRVILTGGDAPMLARHSDWEHHPHLTLIGLNEIMMHNDR